MPAASLDATGSVCSPTANVHAVLPGAWPLSEWHGLLVMMESDLATCVGATAWWRGEKKASLLLEHPFGKVGKKVRSCASCEPSRFFFFWQKWNVKANVSDSDESLISKVQTVWFFLPFPFRGSQGAEPTALRNMRKGTWGWLAFHF